MSKFIETLRILFGVPKSSKSSSYLGRLRNLLVLEVYVLLIFGIVNRVFKSTLVFDKINLIASVIVVICVAICYKTLESPKEYVSFLVAGVISITFLTQTVILNIDRSRSFYVLGWVANHSIMISPYELNLNDVLSKEKENSDAVRYRISEQIDRGLMVVNNDVLALTGRGILLVRFSDCISQVFDLRGWKANRE
jgi:hypothetical protein